MFKKILRQKITAKEIWVTPDIDEDRELIPLVCWAPVFENLSEGDRGQITFLWLDEALGGLQVSSRIGAIEIHGDSLQKAMPLAELPEFIAEVEETHQWESLILGEAYPGYEVKERPNFQPSFLRSDIF